MDTAGRTDGSARLTWRASKSLDRVVRCEAVSTNEDTDHDACPNCGARVESTISAPGEALREATKRRCPSCGKLLRRDVGGEWTIDEAAS